MAARAWGARWPARSAKTSAPASSTRSSRATCASVRRPATGCPSRGMMRPALAATPTSISPRRSCLVREKKALGKGLGALIGEGRSTLGRAGGAGGEGRLRELPLAEIAVNRRQPRRTFAADELEELAASIRALGVVQPVVVRPLQPAAPAAVAGDARPAPAGQAPALPASSGHRYELIAGERRLRAAGLAGLEYIPALVRPADEIASLEIALAENVAREDLNSIEEAQEIRHRDPAAAHQARRRVRA